MIELRRLEKEEEKRAREKIRQKLEEDKVSSFSTSSSRIFLALSFNLTDVENTSNRALNVCLGSQAERRRKLGLPPEDPAAAKPSAPAPVEEKKVFPFESEFSFIMMAILQTSFCSIFKLTFCLDYWIAEMKIVKSTILLRRTYFIH